MKTTIVLCALVVGACGGPEAGYAIDFDLTLADGVPQEAIDQLATLRMVVTGAESFDQSVTVAGKFKNRRERLRYKPGATTTGELDFGFSASTTSVVARGSAVVMVKPGQYQVVPVTLGTGDAVDLSVVLDLGSCGNGIVDPGEECDPAAASKCPASVADCDDHNDCTDDAFAGAGCLAKCTHTAVTNGGSCTVTAGDAGKSGVCLGGSCCTGCIKNGLCKAGGSAAKECGSAGNDCFDCTANSATATCNAGQCSGCDVTSCTNDSRTCGTSTCGFNCGSCADSCSGAGVVTKYACTGKTCQANGAGNCGLYATCGSGGATCPTTCAGDGECQSNAFCDAARHCVQKVGKGGPCTAETAGDHECQAPYVCSWNNTGTSGYCVPAKCSGCLAVDTSGNCSSFIAYGYDPRHKCAYVDSCHRSSCGGPYGWGNVGSREGCDYGFDENGTGRPCGTNTCSNGILSGQLCHKVNPDDDSTCTAGVTDSCGGRYLSCPCNGTYCSTTCTF